MGQKKTNKQMARLSASYTAGASFANITGLILTVISSGYYDIASNLGQIFVGASASVSFRLAINGSAIGGTEKLVTITTNPNYLTASYCVDEIYLKKGDIISVQMVGNTYQLIYSAGSAESFLSITKRS